MPHFIVFINMISDVSNFMYFLKATAKVIAMKCIKCWLTEQDAKKYSLKLTILKFVESKMKYEWLGYVRYEYEWLG